MCQDTGTVSLQAICVFTQLPAFPSMVDMHDIISQRDSICNLNLTFYVVGLVVNCIGFYYTNYFCKPVGIV
ncbi:MAG: hypothetical protein HW390_2387 [Candidatus Brocadiaceae bacterium]|nr:hypothetical protein [Candidatus Brocadiaceae bacterium]